MNGKYQPTIRRFYAIVAAVSMIAITAMPAISGEYAALEGVKSVKTVFDVSQGSPQTANVVFWAVNNVIDDKSVRALSEPPQVAVVFHGLAVKMISTDRNGFKESDKEALDKFANMIQHHRQ